MHFSGGNKGQAFIQGELPSPEKDANQTKLKDMNGRQAHTYCYHENTSMCTLPDCHICGCANQAHMPNSSTEIPSESLILDKCTAKLISVSSFQLQPLAKR